MYSIFCMFGSSLCFENATILDVPLPGTGSFGLPLIFATASADQRLSSDFLTMPLTLKQPFSVPTMCSPDLIVHPSHTPSSNLSLKSPGMLGTFGNLKSIDSPRGTRGTLTRRPFIFCMAVLPSGCSLHLVMTYAACRTIHGTIAASSLIAAPVFSSIELLRVRTIPFTSRIALSILPLESESPTLEFSKAVPASRLCRATSCWSCTIDASWSVLVIILSLASPTV